MVNNERKRRVLMTPMENYTEFIEEYLGKSTKIKEPAYGNVYRFTLDGYKLGIIGLNSAWFSAQHKEIRDGKEDVNDYGYLLLGEPQIYEALGLVADADIRIAIMHHPFEWLMTTDALFERSQIRNRLYKSCHFILHGHEHEANVTLSYNIAGDSITISAGASYDRREPTASRYANGYNFVALDLDARQGTVYLRKYEDRQGWIRDTGTTGDDTPGFYKFVLPKSIGKQTLGFSEDIHPTSKISPSLRQALVKALLESVTMSDRNSRDLVINSLPRELSYVIARHGAALMDVANIVEACLNFKGGMQSLLEAMQFIEGESIAMIKIEQIIRQIQEQ